MVGTLVREFVSLVRMSENSELEFFRGDMSQMPRRVFDMYHVVLAEMRKIEKEEFED